MREWLAKEGHPLEFAVAHTFSAAGFRTRQGDHVRGEETDPVREIDVAATVTLGAAKSMVRIYQLVECKWSQSKPWIVFLGNGHMSSSALIAQTFGSRAARAALWARAGDESLGALPLFATPECPGFGGRQAFGDKNDLFYNTLQSVATKASLLARSYDKPNSTLTGTLEAAVAVFPIVVVDGVLYSAAFDEKENDVQLNEESHIRLHWRGAEAWEFHATIDIVTKAALGSFAKQRFADSMVLAKQMSLPLAQLRDCVAKGSLEPLEVTRGPRGVLGLPSLVRDIKNAFALTAPQDPGSTGA